MELCKYHPNIQAQYYCKECDEYCCSKCSQTNEYDGVIKCLKCESPLYVVEEGSLKSKLKKAIRSTFQLEGDADIVTIEDTYLAKINVFVLDGDFEKTVKLFETAINHCPDDYRLKSKYFQFLVATQAADKLKIFGKVFLMLLVKTHRTEKIYTAYSSIMRIVDNFEIKNLNNKIAVAKACYERGKYMQAVQLLKNAHREHPHDRQLLESFQLIHDSLVFIPGQENTGMKVRMLMKEFEARQKAGNDMVDQTPEKNSLAQDSLRPRKRVDVHGNKKIFNTLSVERIIKDQREKQLKAIEPSSDAPIEFVPSKPKSSPKEKELNLIDEALALDEMNSQNLKPQNNQTTSYLGESEFKVSIFDDEDSESKLSEEFSSNLNQEVSDDFLLEGLDDESKKTIEPKTTKESLNLDDLSINFDDATDESEIESQTGMHKDDYSAFKFE